MASKAQFLDGPGAARNGATPPAKSGWALPGRGRRQTETPDAGRLPEEYIKRFEAAQAAGITPMAYRNFVAFIESWTPPSGPVEMIKHAELRSEQENRVASQRAQAHVLLHPERPGRCRRAQAGKQARPEAMDEHAARQAYYKR
jgi:flagellar FliJ protein